MKNPIKAWSWSRLALFEQCPALHKYRNIDKLPEPKAPAMMRGIKIHNEAAAFLSGETMLLPESCINFADQFRELRAFNPIVEQKWAFTKKMRPTGWMSKDCWLRATLDIGLVYSDGTGEAIDLKTGKKYDDYDDQLDLFAATLIKMHPTEITKSVTVRLWFLDIEDDTQNEVVREISKAEALEKFDDLVRRAEVMMTTNRFPPSPSWKCRFCHFRRDNGGPCEF